MDEAPGSPKIITELIAHVNELEQRIASLQETVSEYHDVQLVGKLDVINLKNEVDKMKLALPSVTEDQMQALQQVSQWLDKSSVKTLLAVEKRVARLEEGAKPVQVDEGQEPRPRNQAILDRLSHLEDLIQEGEARPAPGKTRVAPDHALEVKIDALRSHLKTVETRVADLAKGSRPVPNHPAPAAGRDLTALAARMKELEARVAAAGKGAHAPPGPHRPEQDRRVETLAAAVKAQETRLSALARDVRNASAGATRPAAYGAATSAHAPPADLVALKKHLDAVETKVAALRQEVEGAKRETVTMVLKELRRMVSG
ncbi:MAG: hypothetical protein HY369_02955 [Candidatus Aenigmarchaeota archaeon]|nr:hypothetical protein [Candidatus Aenigmarchaeota archaeon]